MKRLVSVSRNAGVRSLELETEAYEEFKKKLFTALRKFSSSRKTRAVHKLIDNNVINMAIFEGSTAELLVATYGKGNTLGRMLMNIFLFDDSLDSKGSVTLAHEINKYNEQIQKEKTYIKEEQIKNIEVLTEKKEEVTKKFLNSLDYMKLIDGIYFGWLMFLTKYIITEQESLKPKVITTAADTLASVLKKLYMKVNKNMESEVHQLIEAIAIYFIHLYFYGESATYTLNLMKKGFKEETLEPIKMAKVTKFNSFDELGLLLKETGLVAMTTNTFRLQMENMFGKYGYQNYMTPSLVSFVAFLANMTYPTQIFKDSYSIDDNSHKRLEELILNAQKSVTIKKFEI